MANKIFDNAVSNLKTVFPFTSRLADTSAKQGKTLANDIGYYGNELINNVGTPIKYMNPNDLNSVQKYFLDKYDLPGSEGNSDADYTLKLANMIKNKEYGKLAMLRPYKTAKYLTNKAKNEAKYEWNKLSPMGKIGVGVGAGALGTAALAGAGTLAYKLYKKRKEQKQKSKYSK